MEWIATAVAVVAALFTGWQAWEARRSRVEARTSATEAQGYEERAAAASETIAAVLADQHAQAQAERDRYKDPWTVRPVFAAATHSWKFLLGGDEIVTDVRIKIDNDAERPQFKQTPPRESNDMRPGEAFRLDWQRHWGSPTQVVAELHWVRPNGEEHIKVLTLD